MHRVHLDQWEAIELFIRLTDAYKKTNPKSLKPRKSISGPLSYSDLTSTLAEFESKDICEAVALQIFKYKKDGGKRDKGASEFYNLSRHIRLKEPHCMSLQAFNRCKNYIEDHLENASIFDPKILEMWTPSKKLLKYFGTNWWIYTYEEIENQPGIVRGLMSINDFNRVSIINLNVETGLPETYVGRAKIFQTEYLVFDLKTAESNEKNLQIKLFIGSSQGDNLISLGLGEYHNIHDRIYSGTIMIERVSGINIEEFESHFFKQSEKTKTNPVPTHAWKYFSDKRQNRIRIPHGITNVDQFNKWHKRKNTDKS